MSSQTRFGSRLIGFALSLLTAVTVTVAVAVRPAEAQQGLTIKVEGDHFLDRTGAPKFLVFVSYFDALRGNLGSINSDFVNLRAAGVDGVRIFVNWQQFNLPNCSGSYSAYPLGTTVFNQNGTLNGTMLTKLTTILTYARNNGLFVDLTMDKVPGPEPVWDAVLNANVLLMTTTNYRNAIGALTQYLQGQGMRHVMFDLGNERDMSNRAVWIPDAEIQNIKNVVKSYDSERIVMASNTVTSHGGTVTFANNVPLDVVAYHEARPANWYDQTDNVVTSLRAQAPAAFRPIYLQEPERWCSSAPFSAANFLTAVQNAKLAGAGAWTFHTESGFNLQGSSFWTQTQAIAPEAGFFAGLSGALAVGWDACHYTPSALSGTVGSGGGSGSVSMTTGSGCSWNASSPVPWITITSGASGTGSRTVNFTIAANGTGAERTANLTLGPFRQYTVTQQPPAAMSEGYSAAQDFNADGRADIGDFYAAAGPFWIRQNNGNGTFVPPGGASLASGTAAAGSAWKVLIGDFTGDNRADYMDLHLASGNFWVHRNLANGTFDGATWASGTAAAGGGWEVLVGDANGDGYDDLIEHNRSTGQVRARVNSGAPGNTFSFVSGTSYTTPVSADWRLLVADFTGDGWVDIADYHIPSAQFWIHANIGSYVFNNAAWGSSPIPAFNHPVFTTIVGDFTGDGWADYADVQRQTGEFWVHENKRDGTFWPTNFEWGRGLYTSSPGFSILGMPVTMPPQ